MEASHSRPPTESLRIDLSTGESAVEVVVWTVSREGHHTVQHISEWPLGPGQMERVTALIADSVRHWWRPTLWSSDLAELLEETAMALQRP